MDLLNFKKLFSPPTKEELVQKAIDKVNSSAQNTPNLQSGTPNLQNGTPNLRSGVSSDDSSVKSALRMMLVGQIIVLAIYGLIVWFFINYIFVVNPMVKFNYQTLFLVVAWIYLIMTGFTELLLGLMTLITFFSAI